MFCWWRRNRSACVRLPLSARSAVQADVGNDGTATFAAELITNESGFHVLKQGSARASSFVEQPIGLLEQLCDWP